MLKKFLLFIALWLPTAIFSQNIGWVYQHMPSELSPILNASQRFELVEYAKEGKQERAWPHFIGSGTCHKVLCESQRPGQT